MYLSERVAGRPASPEGRSARELRCYDLLDSLGLFYERMDHDPADTMEVCAGIERGLGALICKNLFLCNRQATDFYLLMMPAAKPFKTKELSGQLGTSRLSFAGPGPMLDFLDVTPGSVSVLGLANDRENRVRLLVDEDVLREPYVGCHPCINTSSLRLRTSDVFGPLLTAMRHTMTTVRLVGNGA